MRLIFTDHARERMDFRGITEEMVRQAIDYPERKEDGRNDRVLVFKAFGKGILKVVYVVEDVYVIVSVIWHKRFI